MTFGYGAFLDIVSKVLLALGLLTGGVCLIDWAIRTRKISPFSAISRFFRRVVDPLFRPVEDRIVRVGGQPQNAPLWVFLGVAVAGIVILQVLRILGGWMMEAEVAFQTPRYLPLLFA